MKSIKKLKLLEKEYAIEEVATINAPEDKIRAQRYLGISVIGSSIKALRFASLAEYISCIIYYTNNRFYISKFMHEILSTACNRGCDVYLRNSQGEYKIYQSTIPLKNARDLYLEKKAYKDTDSDVSLILDKMYNGKRIPEKTKVKMKNYIKYYEIPYPHTESEWTNAYYQLKFYIKNKIEYAFDKNLYYICPECGELVRRGTEKEHVCYCDIAPARTHMDYAVNGDDQLAEGGAY